MRTRVTTTGGFTTSNLRRERSRSCDGTYGAWNTLNTTYTGTTVTKETKDCVQPPGFHARRSNGSILPINPFIVETRTETRSTTSWNLSYRVKAACSTTTVEQDGSLMADLSSVFSFKPPDVSSSVGPAVNSAIAQVNSAQLDVLTNLFEARDLPRLFRSAIAAVGGYGARAARQSLSPHQFHSHWLSYRYGWLPLLLTFQDALRAFNEERDGLIREKSSVTITHNPSRSFTTFPNGYQDQIYYENLTSSQRITGMAYGNVTAYSSSFGFDPITTAWELVPFSFVLDWFFQIGDYLQAISPFGVTSGPVVSGYSIRTTSVHTVRGDVLFHDSSTEAASGSGSLGTVVRTVERYERFPLSSSLPVWNPRLSPERLLDAAALVIAQKQRVFSLLFRR